MLNYKGYPKEPQEERKHVLLSLIKQAPSTHIVSWLSLKVIGSCIVASGSLLVLLKCRLRKLW